MGKGSIVPTRNVVLTNHQQDVIDELVQSGRYQNASEVLREGLRLVEQREKEDEARLAMLRAATQVGLRDLENGRYTDVDIENLDSFVSALGDGGPQER